MLKNKHIKIISWVSIACSVVGVVVFLWLLVGYSQASNVAVWLILALSILGLYAGWDVLKGNKLGKKLLVIFWVIQIIQVTSPSFTFALNTGVSFFLSFGSDNTVIGLNIFAFIMFLISIRALREHKYAEVASDKPSI